MSVMEKLRAQQTGAPTTQPPPPPPRPDDRYNPDLPKSGGVETDLGNGQKVWAGYVGPEMATRILEINQNNRPLRDYHAVRISELMKRGRWKENGQTIKIGTNGDVLDGQHRLWAVIYSKCTVWLIIIYGIQTDAFATIDTIQMPRSGADVLAVNGLDRHRARTSSALAWLIRYERGILEEYRARQYRVENFDIENAFAEHPEMVRAVDKVRKLSPIINVSILAFVYYLLVSRDADLAARMLQTLEEPASVSISDPFFRLREAMLSGGAERRRDPLMVIALIIKAVNAARANETIQLLSWRSQGTNPESFPQFWWVLP